MQVQPYGKGNAVTICFRLCQKVPGANRQESNRRRIKDHVCLEREAKLGCGMEGADEGVETG